MKKLIGLTILTYLLNFSTFAQKQSFINVGAGYSHNVNGGLKGFNLNFGYVLDYNRWFALEGNLRAESESKTDRYVYNTYSNNNWVNPTGTAYAEFNFSNGGLQLEVLPKLKLVDNNFKLNIIAGGLFRYTLSQIPESYGVNYPPNTHLPTPTFDFVYNSKPKHFEPGFAVGLEIGAKIGPRSLLTARMLTTNTSNLFIYNFPITYYYQLK